MISCRQLIRYAAVFLMLCALHVTGSAAAGESLGKTVLNQSVEQGEPGDTVRTGNMTYEYYIPYFLADSDYWTGIALRNCNGTGSAFATVYGTSDSGSVLDSETKIIPPEGQTAFMMHPGEGWVKVTSNCVLTGLGFIAEKAGEALMFDIPFVPELAETLYVPHVAQNATWDTIVYVCNPNGSATTMYLTIFDSDGTVVKVSQGYIFPMYGSGRYPLSNLLGAAADYDKGSVRITATQGLAAFALYHNLKTGARSYAGISAVTSKEKPVSDNFTNSIGMTFVPIPAGTFMMGSPTSEPERLSNETQHQVTLTKSFYLQTTEVTQGQWKAVMGSNPSKFLNCGDNCPVEQVSWEDCQLFIAALNQMEGTTKYRLPMEAEWEYACRAGTMTPFNTGYCLSTDQANYDGRLPYTGCPSGIYRQMTVPVKSFSPNAWGLYEMHGNVTEWCQESGNFRSGGRWSSRAGFCRSACRGWGISGFKTDFTGLRVARDF